MIREIDISARRAAGRRLGARLRHYEDESPIVVGLSSGGVIVGAGIAREIRGRLDVMCVREITAPCSEDRPMGAAALGQIAFFDPGVVTDCALTLSRLEQLATPAFIDVKRRTRQVRGRAELPGVAGHVVILADDGSSAREALLAATWALRDAGARRVVLALAISDPNLVDRLREDADEVYCVERSREREIAFEPVDGADVRRVLHENGDSAHDSMPRRRRVRSERAATLSPESEIR